jgi:hypothetical protein
MSVGVLVEESRQLRREFLKDKTNRNTSRASRTLSPSDEELREISLTCLGDLRLVPVCALTSRSCLEQARYLHSADPPPLEHC